MFKLQYIKSCSILFLILSYTSCKKDSWCTECFERTGKIVTVKRSLSPFNQLVVNDNLNVFITQDSVFDVEIEAGENMMYLIKTDVNDSILTIQNKNKCNWTRSFKKPFNIYIKMPQVKYITSLTSGNIKSLNTLTGYKLEIEINGAGDVELTVNNTTITSSAKNGGNLILHGNLYSHVCTMQSPSFLYCKDLVTSYTLLETYTSGLCYINVTNKFDCEIENIGDVYCYGSPTILNKTGNGKGTLYSE